MADEPARVLRFRYRNHRGVVADRRILPINIRFGQSEFHTGYQWFLCGQDLDRNAQRDFAVKDILEFL
jgi:hypothetical protein